MHTKMLMILISMSVAAGNLYAATDDSVCESLEYATPGLYGLCIAFCKAQPPDSMGYLDLTNSQQKLLRAYNHKKTDEDPDMPCFEGCPCFSIEEAEFVATHENYYRCTDYFQEEKFGTWYEISKNIAQAGDIDQFGKSQTFGDVSAYEVAPGELNCGWDYKSASPDLKLERNWFSPYEEDRAKFEDCLTIIDYVVSNENLECETLPECERRILIEYPTSGDKPTLTVNGVLINDPNEECVNDAPIAWIEWYWGDGSVDVFGPEPDGYIYPFPNSHTYTETGLFVWMMYAFDEEGRIVSSAGNFYFNW